MKARMVMTSRDGERARQTQATTRRAANETAFQPGASRTSKPAVRVLYPADLGEVMGVLEDLWLRMARHPALHLAVVEDPATEQSTVLIRVDGEGMSSEALQLLDAASHTGNYLWSQGGNKGSLVSDLHWIGSTLVIELTPLHQMRRWPIGDSLVLAMQALLQRVKQLGACT
jgi:hypothetical protein